VDVRTIQMLLGHADIKTTMRYLQVTQKHISSIQSPFTLLRLPRREDLDQE
jgi:site-specific recombinase XerD